MSRPVVGVLLLACLAVCGVAQGAPVQWPIGVGGNGHFYEPVAAGLSWTEASAAATAAGGYLATITSEAEGDFVFSLVADKPELWEFHNNGWYGPWLGGFQPPGSAEPDGDWQWVTGEPFSYTNWTAGEPNQWEGWEEDCLRYKQKGSTLGPEWNDEVDSPTVTPPTGYVIEIPEPATLSLLAVGGLLLFRRRQK